VDTVQNKMDTHENQSCWYSVSQLSSKSIPRNSLNF